MSVGTDIIGLTFDGGNPYLVLYIISRWYSLTF